MSQEAEWLRRQGEYNRSVYGRPEADHDDPAGWKAAVLFYSIRRYTGSIIGSTHGRDKFPRTTTRGTDGSRTSRPRCSAATGICLMSMRAGCREGFRRGDARRRLAVKLLGHLEKEIPFP